MNSLSKSESRIKNRGDFSAFLALEYLDYSRKLSDKHNFSDADYFAKKGLDASNNQPIYPEVPEAWKIDASEIEELILARQKLLALSTDQVKQVLPIQLAHLNMLYDCWISSDKKSAQFDMMSKCKFRFFDLVDEMEKYVASLNPKNIVEEEEIKEPEFTKFDIYFDLDSYKFNEKANENFVDILTYLSKLNGNYRILLVGAADRTGRVLHNEWLARQRILSAKNILIKNGVPEHLIETKSYGSNNPEIITKNYIQNQSNRKVGVYILKGQDSLSVIPLPLIDDFIYKKSIAAAKKARGVKK